MLHKRGRCKHFNGTINDCCEAGVNYQQLVGLGKKGLSHNLPCWDKYSGPDVPICDKREEPTAEEIAESERVIQESINRMRLVAPIISDMKRRHKGKSAQETVECPVCKGKLHLSIAGYNGHVHGHCETENCLAWME